MVFFEESWFILLLLFCWIIYLIFNPKKVEVKKDWEELNKLKTKLIVIDTKIEQAINRIASLRSLVHRKGFQEIEEPLIEKNIKDDGFNFLRSNEWQT